MQKVKMDQDIKREWNARVNQHCPAVSSPLYTFSICSKATFTLIQGGVLNFKKKTPSIK